MWTMVVFSFCEFICEGIEKFIKYSGNIAGICSFGLLFWLGNLCLRTFSRLVKSNMIFVLGLCLFLLNHSLVKKKLLLFLQIQPLVKPTRAIVKMTGIQYSWHDFVSRSKPLMMNFTVYRYFLWAIYFIGVYILLTCEKYISFIYLFVVVFMCGMLEEYFLTFSLNFSSPFASFYVGLVLVIYGFLLKKKN